MRGFVKCAVEPHQLWSLLSKKSLLHDIHNICSFLRVFDGLGPAM
jgi:hypothetical protein